MLEYIRQSYSDFKEEGWGGLGRIVGKTWRSKASNLLGWICSIGKFYLTGWFSIGTRFNQGNFNLTFPKGLRD